MRLRGTGNNSNLEEGTNTKKIVSIKKIIFEQSNIKLFKKYIAGSGSVLLKYGTVQKSDSRRSILRESTVLVAEQTYCEMELS